MVSGGTLVDGTGAPPLRADVGIRGDKVVAIGDLGGASARRIVDASGKLVTPGFVDSHAHTDFSLHVNPQAHSHLMQGVTTVVVGNCGKSPYPLPVPPGAGTVDHIGRPVDLSQGAPDGAYGARFLTRAPWTQPAGFFTELGSGAGLNVASLVGHTTLRASRFGAENRPATPDELRAMKDDLRRCLEAGAIGLSTGLQYAPASAAPTEEVVALCQVVAEYGGIYASHIRDYSYPGIFDALDEAVEIGRRTGIPVVISHLGLHGPKLWGRAGDVAQLLADANREGVEVIADVMTYGTAGAWWAPRAVLPEEVHDWRQPWAVNAERLRSLLASASSRSDLINAIEGRRSREKNGLDELRAFSSWRQVLLDEADAAGPWRQFVGTDFEAIATELGSHPAEVFLDCALGEGEAFSAVHLPQQVEDHHALLEDPNVAIGCSDSLGLCLEMQDEPAFQAIQAHPRHYGSFARAFATFVRDEGLLDIAEAVRKCTSLPAATARLRGRGSVAVDNYADLVVFDIATINETASFRQPRGYPVGIDAVIVNGAFAVEGGRLTDELNGTPLRKG